MGKTLVEIVADIVQSQCGTKKMSADEIAFALQSTFNSLQALQALETKSAVDLVAMDTAAGAEKKTDISPEKSILKHKIICLECGQEFKILSPKHLKSHDLDGRAYRKKHGLPRRQPLCAKTLSEQRKIAGKNRGIPLALKKVIEARQQKAAARKGATPPSAPSAGKTSSRKKTAAPKKAAVKKQPAS